MIVLILTSMLGNKFFIIKVLTIKILLIKAIFRRLFSCNMKGILRKFFRSIKNILFNIFNWFNAFFNVYDAIYT